MGRYYWPDTFFEGVCGCFLHGSSYHLTEWIEMVSEIVLWNVHFKRIVLLKNPCHNFSDSNPLYQVFSSFIWKKGWNQEWAWPTKKTGIERAWARDICLYFGRYDSWGLLLNLMTSYWLDHTPSVMSLWAWLLETSHFLTEFFKI